MKEGFGCGSKRARQRSRGTSNFIGLKTMEIYIFQWSLEQQYILDSGLLPFLLKLNA